MKLIDLLAKELPKRGGWPDGVGRISMHADGAIFFDGTAPDNIRLPKCDDGWNSEIHPFKYTNDVTREQYEAALTASQKGEWDGEGLPPIGAYCEITDPDGVLIYGQDESGEVVAHVENTAVIRMSYGLGCFESRFLRPLRSEADKKRDEAKHAIAELCRSSASNGHSADLIYDAIKSGRIVIE